MKLSVYNTEMTGSDAAKQLINVLRRNHCWRDVRHPKRQESKINWSVLLHDVPPDTSFGSSKTYQGTFSTKVHVLQTHITHLHMTSNVYAFWCRLLCLEMWKQKKWLSLSFNCVKSKHKPSSLLLAITKQYCLFWCNSVLHFSSCDLPLIVPKDDWDKTTATSAYMCLTQNTNFSAILPVREFLLYAKRGLAEQFSNDSLCCVRQTYSQSRKLNRTKGKVLIGAYPEQSLHWNEDERMLRPGRPFAEMFHGYFR